MKQFPLFVIQMADFGIEILILWILNYMKVKLGKITPVFN